MLTATHVGAAGPRHRPRRERVDGEEEARGLFLMKPPQFDDLEALSGRAGGEDAAALPHLRSVSTTASRR